MVNYLMYINLSKDINNFDKKEYLNYSINSNSDSKNFYNMESDINDTCLTCKLEDNRFDTDEKERPKSI